MQTGLWAGFLFGRTLPGSRPCEIIATNISDYKLVSKSEYMFVASKIRFSITFASLWMLFTYFGPFKPGTCHQLVRYPPISTQLTRHFLPTRQHLLHSPFMTSKNLQKTSSNIAKGIIISSNSPFKHRMDTRLTDTTPLLHPLPGLNVLQDHVGQMHYTLD